MTGNYIKCPKCGEAFEPSEAFRHQVEEGVLKSLRDKHNQELKKARLEVERELKESQERQYAEMKKLIAEKDEKLAGMRDAELALREEKRKIEEEKKEMELAVQRQIDEKRAEIEQKILKKADDEHRLRDAEKDKMISDLKKSLEEAQRKAQQGSQQLQGEVLELDFEEALRTNFNSDKIEPVGKGVRGADIRQTVVSPRGVICGVILWETKRTKAWSDIWVEKLKDDLRAEKANIPVIVTAVMPRDIDTAMGIKDGVWVVDYSLAITLAQLLRKNLLDVGYQKALSAHRGEKADHLYEYITSHEFRQQVEAMVEVYTQMKLQISKEKASYERMWKAREVQVERLFSSTANIVGSIQGNVGQTAFQVRGMDVLELPEQNDLLK